MCEHLFDTIRDSWYCVRCGIIAPACFVPKPEHIASPFVAVSRAEYDKALDELLDPYL